MSAQSPSPDLVREFVIAGHGNLARVKELIAQQPQLLNMAHEWNPGDTETAIQGAAHVGSGAIAEYLLKLGAPLEICTAAMLGHRRAIERMLADDPSLIRAKGAHGIPLLTHAALSGDAGLLLMLYERGAHDGASAALSNVVAKGHYDAARWLLERASPDLNWKNFRGKTALALAEERGDRRMVALLREHGAAPTRLDSRGQPPIIRNGLENTGGTTDL